jgi:Rieske Fe-S protein
MSSGAWIGVDLDGTLAEYHGWQGVMHIGPPVPAMLERVKLWLAEGRDVRIFTARVTDGEVAAITAIETWCTEHLGCILPITNVKDFGMVELWDDRAITVEQNTGKPLAPEQPRFTP